MVVLHQCIIMFKKEGQMATNQQSSSVDAAVSAAAAIQRAKGGPVNAAAVVASAPGGGTASSPSAPSGAQGQGASPSIVPSRPTGGGGAGGAGNGSHGASGGSHGGRGGASFGLLPRVAALCLFLAAILFFVGLWRDYQEDKDITRSLLRAEANEKEAISAQRLAAIVRTTEEIKPQVKPAPVQQPSVAPVPACGDVQVFTSGTRFSPGCTTAEFRFPVTNVEGQGFIVETSSGSCQGGQSGQVCIDLLHGSNQAKVTVGANGFLIVK